MDEYLGMSYYHQTGLPITLVRFFNVVGPRQRSRYGAVLPEFIEQALSGAPLTIFGSGEQRRSFSYVRDVAQALTKIAQRDQTIGEIINIGSGHEVSINELAVLVRRIGRSASAIIHVPYAVAYGEGFEDSERRIPSLEKMERLLNMTISTPLEEIIASLISAIRARNRSSFEFGERIQRLLPQA
jgi:nucleoside-diphosphate-sugar epimerase